NTPGLPAAYHQVDDYYNDTVKLDGKVVRTHFDAVFGPGARTAFAQRWGGAYQHAADGLLSQASVYSPANPAHYMIDEPQPRGEAFIPGCGTYDRSMGILSTAANWLGAMVIPGIRAGLTHGGDGAAYPTRVTHNTNNIYQPNFGLADLETLQRVQ